MGVVVIWNGVLCPANGRFFTLQLNRVRDGATNIGIIAIDSPER